VYPDKNAIKAMAEYVARWTFRHLVQTTDIDSVPSSVIAAAAADRYAQALELAISENQTPAESEPPLPSKTDLAAATGILNDAIDRHLRREPNAPPIRARRPRRKA
jgi:hypothetical protein